MFTQGKRAIATTDQLVMTVKEEKKVNAIDLGNSYEGSMDEPI